MRQTSWHDAKPSALNFEHIQLIQLNKPEDMTTALQIADAFK